MPGRRATALLLTFALGVALTSPAAAGGAAQPLDRELDAALNAFPATAALIVSDPASGFRYTRNADMQFFSASLYKLGLMVEAYGQAAAGALSLDDTMISVTDLDLSEDDGWYVDAGTSSASARRSSGPSHGPTTAPRWHSSAPSTWRTSTRRSRGSA